MGSERFTPIWNGLWSQKHHNKLGPAWMLFGFLLSKASKNGEVKISYQTISDKTDVSIRSLGYWMRILKKEKYVSVKKAQTMIIQIHNFRSIKDAKPCQTIRQGVAEPSVEVMQSLAEPSCNPLPNLIQDVAEPIAVSANNERVSEDPINSFKIKDKKKRSTSKKSNDFERREIEVNWRQNIFTQEDKDTATFILGKIQNIQPGFKEPSLETWANDIRLIREKDGRALEEIRSLFAWANNHHFWKGNILSPAKLRKQWDALEIQKKSNGNGNGNGYRSQADINSASTGQVVI
jgi:hypothetical protein